MKHLFLLGRNPELSKAELFSYLEKEKIAFDYSEKENSILIKADNIKKDIIKNLGGTIAIGRVLFSGSIQEILMKIESQEIYFGGKNKFNYTLLDYCGEENTIDDVYSKIKEKLKKERFKAQFRNTRGIVKAQDRSIISGSPSKLAKDTNFFVFKEPVKSSGFQYNFGVIEQVYDAKEAEKRDMQKPVRREELAISPRLAKILINLSQAKPGETILDPFCGIGVILQEALLQGINSTGIEISKQASESAKKNIVWLKQNYKINAECKIINEDSRKAALNNIDAIATEPSLGELLKIPPKKEQAELIVKQFENLIIQVLRNLKKSLKQKGKIALTAPVVKSKQGFISSNTERISKETGLKLYNLKDVKFPIKEFRAEQIVSREIFVLEK